MGDVQDKPGKVELHDSPLGQRIAPFASPRAAMATPHGIRSLAEYASDSDYDDADTLVDGRASGFKRGHRVRPSADALLGDSLVSTLSPDDRLRRLQQYEADAPVSSRRPLLRQVLASGHGVAAFVSRNEGAFSSFRTALTLPAAGFRR